MSINPREEELRRLTVVKAMVRKEIDTTKDMKKKEILRKKQEVLNEKVNAHLKNMNLKY